MAITLQNTWKHSMETMPTNRPSQTKDLGITDKIANVPRPYTSILKISLFSHITTLPYISHDAIQVHVCFEKLPTILSNEYQEVFFLSLSHSLFYTPF